MERYTNFVLRHKKFIVAATILLSLISAVALFGVHVNYNLVDYLPESAPSTRAVQIMEQSFSDAVPNARVLLRDVTLSEARAAKSELSAIDGVTSVQWLDDIMDLKVPIEFADSAAVETFYKGKNALYQLRLAPGKEVDAIRDIRAHFGSAVAVSGEAADTGSMRENTVIEIGNSILVLAPAIIVLLILSTGAWIEPLLFIAAIGASILMNMGSNLFLGEVSFITFAVAPVLQLAVSLDYAIFLLHSYEEFLKEEETTEAAMKRAMKKSVKAVAASAITTLFGFLALTFMKFGIGADLGLNLTKGVLLSFLSCMVFLPALTLLCHGTLLKTRHRPFLPAFRTVHRVLSKAFYPVLILVALLTLPAFLGQRHVVFTYGSEEKNENTRNYRDNALIHREFGKNTLLALLVPKGDIARETLLSNELAALPRVKNVASYAKFVGPAIPQEVMEDEVLKNFYGGDYARLVLTLDTPSEGNLAFSVVEQVRDVAARYYPDAFYMAGPSANLYDMREVVKSDNQFVNAIAIVAIFLVLVFTFRAAVLPFLLLFTIEVGIWINLSIPYFTGTSLHFMGYLVISTVQLGATVDYAILLTSYYLDNRRCLPQRTALAQSLGETFKSILISAATLSFAGFALSWTSGNPIVSELGALLGRGTIFSMLMVLLLLPMLLTLFDRAIGATTKGAHFYDSRKAQAEGGCNE